MPSVACWNARIQRCQRTLNSHREQLSFFREVELDYLARLPAMLEDLMYLRPSLIIMVDAVAEKERELEELLR